MNLSFWRTQTSKCVGKNSGWRKREHRRRTVWLTPKPVLWLLSTGCECLLVTVCGPPNALIVASLSREGSDKVVKSRRVAAMFDGARSLFLCSKIKVATDKGENTSCFLASHLESILFLKLANYAAFFFTFHHKKRRKYLFWCCCLVRSGNFRRWLRLGGAGARSV